jgi:hypothetical protein
MPNVNDRLMLAFESRRNEQGGLQLSRPTFVVAVVVFFLYDLTFTNMSYNDALASYVECTQWTRRRSGTTQRRFKEQTGRGNQADNDY